MNYEAIILDINKGQFRRGTGPNPVSAVLKAWRQILKSELPEDKEREVDNIGPGEIMQMFCMVTVDDDMMADAKNLKEEPSDLRVLVQVDRTKETMFTPRGWVRPLL